MSPDQAYAQAIADLANLAQVTADGIDAIPVTDLHATRRVFASAALRSFAEQLRTQLLAEDGSPKSTAGQVIRPSFDRLDALPGALARAKGYVGEACPDCQNFTMVRNGTCLKCDTCGSTTGCS